MATKTETTYSTKNQRLTIMGAIQYNTDLKVQLALDYSNGRTDSLSKLFFDEASALIKSLKGGVKEYRTPKNLQFNKNNTKQEYILSLCHQLEWQVDNARHGKVADIKRLNEWLMSKKSPVKKLLIDLSDSELSKAVFVLEQMIIKKK